MPKVGKKEFSYDKEGKSKAKAYAKKTGQEVEYPTYDAGGRVETYREGGKVESPVSKGLKKTRELRTALKPKIVKEIEKSKKGQESWEALNKKMDEAGATKYKKGGKVESRKIDAAHKAATRRRMVIEKSESRKKLAIEAKQWREKKEKEKRKRKNPFTGKSKD